MAKKRNHGKVLLVLLVATVLLLGSMCIVSLAAAEHSILPDTLPEADITGGAGKGDPGTSGVQFATNVDGEVTKVRLWIVEGRSAVQSVSIWSTSDTPTKLAGPYDWTIDQSKTGWQSFVLPEAVDITANATYAVVISDGGDCLSAIHGYWGNNTPASSVFTQYERGFSGAKDTLPTNWNSDGTYLVDVVFVEAGGSDEPVVNPGSGDEGAAGLLLLFSGVLLSLTIWKKKACVN